MSLFEVAGKDLSGGGRSKVGDVLKCAPPTDFLRSGAQIPVRLS